MIRKYRFVFAIRAISKDNEKIFNKKGRFFLSKKYKNFEETIRNLFLSQRPDDFQMFETEDLSVSLKFVFVNRVHCDLFNLPKSVCDALNGCIWKDDKQIKSGSVEIEYGQLERIELEVFNIE